MKTIRLVVALLASIGVAAVLNSLVWPQDAMLQAIALYSFYAAMFAIWIGLPAYSYLRARRRDTIFATVVVIALMYGFVYFLGRTFLSLSINLESIDGKKVIDHGLPTLHGLFLYVIATAEVVAVGLASNLTFWLILARTSRKAA